jgi:hemerythrin-like domain-containing protein
MEKASQDLVHEHKAILIILSVLEKICSLFKTSKEVDYHDIEQIIDFIKTFADKCHHGKEEGFLFPALEEAGIKKENGPIGVMLLEHEKGRELVRLMQSSISGESIQIEKFVESSDAYINLLRNHIEKENSILFPMGDARLSQAKQDELLNKFETFEDEVIGKGKHHELHQILEKFEAKYLKQSQ